MSKKKWLLVSVLILILIGFYAIDIYRTSATFELDESISNGDWKIHYSITKNKKENSLIYLNFEYLGPITDIEIDNIVVRFIEPINFRVTMRSTEKSVNVLPTYRLEQQPLPNTERMNESKLKELLSDSYCEIEFVDQNGQLRKQKIFFW